MAGPATPTRQAAPGGASPPAEPGRLRGEISFSRLEPVVGANVVLIREGDPRRLYLGVTDTHGYFRFESIPGGSWSLGVVRDGVAPEVKTGIRVQPPARAVVDMVLKRSAARLDPPVFDLARYEAPGGGPEPRPDLAAAAPAASAPAAGADVAAGAPQEGMVVRVLDSEMKAVREARVSMRSRGPLVDPIRAVTDGDGFARSRAPEPGEYVFRVEVPGYLPARIDRLVLGRSAPIITAVLTSRPLDYPARPVELLPEEKPVPPEGFPGSRETRPGPAAPP